MVPKTVLSVLAGAVLLSWSGGSLADPYKPGEFFNLDLSRAVLSPEPLGPETQFAPVRIEASSGNLAAAVPPPPKAAARIRVARTGVAETRVVERRRLGKPHHSARARLARRHSNPLDAEAMDTRIQVWPCRSGGICHWRQP